MPGNDFDASGSPYRVQTAGHWAEGKAVHLARGFDQMATETGLPDGSALIEKATGHGADAIALASDWQFREWFQACYAFAHPGQARRLGDIVMYNSTGIFSCEAGWTAPANLSGG